MGFFRTKGIAVLCLAAFLLLAAFAVASAAAVPSYVDEPQPAPKQDMTYLDVIDAVLSTSPPDPPEPVPDPRPWYMPEEMPAVPEQPEGMAVIYDPPDLAVEQLEIPLLVNETHPLGEEYVPEELVSYRSTNQQLIPEARFFLNLMAYAARQEGAGDIKLVSGYRTYAHQKALYDAKVKQFAAYGDDAYAMAAMYVMYPGASEHQSGMTADISDSYSLSTSFGSTVLGLWLRDNAHKYGFIMRYPKDKVEITKVSYEPWHYRYVGRIHAEYIYEHDLCLEEYVELITQDR